MPMPKGYKKETGYGSKKQLGGLTYHEIAAKMNEKDFKMNHSTVRNVFVQGLIKIAKNLSSSSDLQLDKSDLKKIAIDPRFQEAVSEYMKELEYEQNK